MDPGVLLDENHVSTFKRADGTDPHRVHCWGLSAPSLQLLVRKGASGSAGSNWQVHRQKAMEFMNHPVASLPVAGFLFDAHSLSGQAGLTVRAAVEGSDIPLANDRSILRSTELGWALPQHCSSSSSSSNNSSSSSMSSRSGEWCQGTSGRLRSTLQDDLQRCEDVTS